ncbi:heterokaryon incompatibility protein-domain-containing protein [Hypoxylon sp. NC1633]|nr:heterokaryon incompatibility protein-domain-containing protein [Hypoxylon sp. NC1633]
MTDQLIYSPIGPKSIRLILIVPGFADETINCSLITIHDMDDAPMYDAISYVWGTELSKEPIRCNGQTMEVTKNLIEAMRYLRPLPQWDSVTTWPEKHALHSSHNVWRGFAKNRQEDQEHSSSRQQRLIWIDAICINQKDNAEKADQIKLMDKIYANANTVKIWLGKVNDTNSTARPSHPMMIQQPGGILQPQGLGLPVGDFMPFRMQPGLHIGQYGQMPVILTFIAQALRNVRAGDNYSTESRSAIDTVYRNRVHGFPSATSEDWEDLRSFFNNPWFLRIWVVQEIVLARRAIAILGDWEVEWRALGEAATWFQTHGFALPTTIKFAGKLGDLLPVSKVAAMWQMHATPGKRRPLLQVLRDLRGRKTTLEVDKIYAAYSLAEETSNTSQLHPLIEPTYEKPYGEVYRNVVRYLVVEHGDLSALSHAGGIQGVKTSAWPSWVPDWSLEKASVELVSDSEEDSPYEADGNMHLTIGDSIDPTCLSMKGFRVTDGVIQAYGDKLVSYGFRHTTYKEEHDFVRSAWSLIARWVDRGSGQENDRLKTSQPDNMSRTFVSTLTAGLSDKKESIWEDPDFLEDAAQWLLRQFSGRIPVSGISVKWRWPGTIWRTSDSGRFHEAFTRACLHRRFFITTGKLMGIGPETMENGDIVVILFGGKVPYVVRQLNQARYLFIGECYIPGLMAGEAVGLWKANGRKTELFNLV